MMMTGVFAPTARRPGCRRGGERVGRRNRGDAENRAAEEAYRTLFQALVDQVGLGRVVRVMLLRVETVLHVSDGVLSLRSRGSASRA